MTDTTLTITKFIQNAATVVAGIMTLSGAAYAAFDYFATKKELNQIQCKTELNITYIKAKQNSSQQAPLIQSNIKERRAIQAKRGLTDDERLLLSNLEIVGTQLNDDLKKFNMEADEAAKKLDRQECAK